MIGDKITLLPYVDYGIKTSDYNLPTIGIGELRSYSITPRSHNIKLPSGGRYLAMFGSSTGSTSEGYVTSYRVEYFSGGRVVAKGHVNLDLFYLRID